MAPNFAFFRTYLENRLTPPAILPADNSMRLVLCFMALAFCAENFAADKKMVFRPGAKPMRNELRRFIQTGMKISAAEEVMTANGFACKRKVNDDFLATDQGSTDSKFIQRKNFLYCDYTEAGYSAISPARRWQVALINENEKVALVLVSYGLIGP